MAVITTTPSSKRLERKAKRLLGEEYGVICSDGDSWGKYLLLRNNKCVYGLGWDREGASQAIDRLYAEASALAQQQTESQINTATDKVARDTEMFNHVDV